MTLQEILSGVGGGDLAKSARAFVEAAGVFVGELSKTNHGFDLAVNSLNTSDTDAVDYDSPVLDAYKKTYKPITPSEIVQVNKAMSEAISGEKWVAGFMACVQLMAMLHG